MWRLLSPLVEVTRHWRGILARKADGNLMKRYFVAHANVRNATRLAPIAIQTHTDMTFPQYPVSL